MKRMKAAPGFEPGGNSQVKIVTQRNRENRSRQSRSGSARKRLAPLLAALPLCGLPASAADTYLALRVGPAWWSATSNHEEVETGTESGLAGALALGWELGKGDVGADLELETRGAWHPLHGRNENGVLRSADGKSAWLIQESVIVAPTLHVGWLSVYAGGGGGASLFHAFSNFATAAHATVRVGMVASLSDLGDVEIGASKTWLKNVQVNGLRAQYDDWSATVGFRWHWRRTGW